MGACMVQYTSPDLFGVNMRMSWTRTAAFATQMNGQYSISTIQLSYYLSANRQLSAGVDLRVKVWLHQTPSDPRYGDPFPSYPGLEQKSQKRRCKPVQHQRKVIRSPVRKFLGGNNMLTQAAMRTSEYWIRQLHGKSSLRSWYLQSSRVQGENNRLASSRNAVKMVVNVKQSITVAMISVHRELGSSKLGVTPGGGGTAPSMALAIVMCLLRQGMGCVES